MTPVGLVLLNVYSNRRFTLSLGPVWKESPRWSVSRVQRVYSALGTSVITGGPRTHLPYEWEKLLTVSVALLILAHCTLQRTPVGYFEAFLFSGLSAAPLFPCFPAHTLTELRSLAVSGSLQPLTSLRFVSKFFLL